MHLFAQQSWTGTNSSIFGSETSRESASLFTNSLLTHLLWGKRATLDCYISQTKVLSFLACLFIVVAPGGLPAMSLHSLLNSGSNSSTAPATQSMALLAHWAVAALPCCFRLRDCRKAERSVRFQSGLDPSQCRHHSLSAATCSQSRSISTSRTLSFSAAAIELPHQVSRWFLLGSAARTPSDLKRRVNNLLPEISCHSWC